MYKFLIEVSETREGLYILNAVRSLLFGNYLYLLRVYIDTLSSNNSLRYFTSITKNLHFFKLI